MREQELSKLQTDYREYFAKLLKDMFDADSPADLSDEEKVEFFNAVHAGWEKGKGAKKEEQEIREMVNEELKDMLTEDWDTLPYAIEIIADNFEYYWADLVAKNYPDKDPKYIKMPEYDIRMWVEEHPEDYMERMMATVWNELYRELEKRGYMVD